MKERPILMSAPMVRALLAGTKTQTRRAIKPQPDTWPGMECTRLLLKDRKGRPLLDEALEAKEPTYLSLCPYGVPGDPLWVRESHRTYDVYNGESFARMQERLQCTDREMASVVPLQFDADQHRVNWTAVGAKPGRGRPSIHMPRWASRITLEITEVRVERLQDISEDDARAEGCDLASTCDHVRRSCADVGCPGPTYREGYAALWDAINGAGGWAANPFVWVLVFRRVDPC